MTDSDTIVQFLDAVGLWGTIALLIVIAAIAYVFKAKTALTNTLSQIIDKQTSIQTESIESVKEANKEIKQTTIDTLTSVRELTVKIESVVDLVKTLALINSHEQKDGEKNEQ